MHRIKYMKWTLDKRFGENEVAIAEGRVVVIIIIIKDIVFLAKHEMPKA